MLCHPDPAFTRRKIVFLLAGHRTGLAAGAIVILYQQTILRHDGHSYSLILLSLQRVVLYCPPPKPEPLSWGPGIIWFIW